MKVRHIKRRIFSRLVHLDPTSAKFGFAMALWVKPYPTRGDNKRRLDGWRRYKRASDIGRPAVVSIQGQALPVHFRIRETPQTGNVRTNVRGSTDGTDDGYIASDWDLL